MNPDKQQIEALKIQRYRMQIERHPISREIDAIEMQHNNYGEYVKYSDHQEIISSLLEQIKQKDEVISAAKELKIVSETNKGNIVISGYVFGMIQQALDQLEKR